jgi:hypothetical protein
LSSEVAVGNLKLSLADAKVVTANSGTAKHIASNNIKLLFILVFILPSFSFHNCRQLKISFDLALFLPCFVSSETEAW